MDSQNGQGTLQYNCDNNSNNNKIHIFKNLTIYEYTSKLICKWFTTTLSDCVFPVWHDCSNSPRISYYLQQPVIVMSLIGVVLAFDEYSEQWTVGISWPRCSHYLSLHCLPVSFFLSHPLPISPVPDLPPTTTTHEIRIRTVIGPTVGGALVVLLSLHWCRFLFEYRYKNSNSSIGIKIWKQFIVTLFEHPVHEHK